MLDTRVRTAFLKDSPFRVEEAVITDAEQWFNWLASKDDDGRWVHLSEVVFWALDTLYMLA